MTKQQATGAVLAVVIGAAIAVSMIHTPSDSTTAPSATGSGSASGYTADERAWLTDCEADASSVSTLMLEIGTLAGAFPNITDDQATTLGADLATLVGVTQPWLDRPSPSARFDQLTTDWTTAMTDLNNGATEAETGMTTLDASAVARADEDIKAANAAMEAATSDIRLLNAAVGQ